MADLIVLAQSIPLKLTSSGILYQDIKEAVDVSAYDSIDFSVSVTSNHADGATVTILTSIQNQIDDLASGLTNPSWYSVGSAAFTGTAGNPGYKSVSVPSSSGASPLLRYVRYMLTFGTNTTQASVSIVGLARRGLRVG